MGYSYLEIQWRQCRCLCDIYVEVAGSLFPQKVTVWTRGTLFHDPYGPHIEHEYLQTMV